MITLIVSGVAALFAFIFVYMILCLRTVVPTNEVHIVQSAKKTVSYGANLKEAAGNTYYKWPSWIPFIGVKTSILPVSVFDVKLTDYAAYDKGRVPFMLDIIAFFRIEEPNMAAQRVASFQELGNQLEFILQGAIRSILASEEIEEIMQGRSKFGDLFTKEVNAQLKEWGVCTVKNIELMDIRDHQGSQVIANIMAKKKSLVEMQSRVEVANNQRAAQEAEITAARQVALQKQEAEEQVGTRTAIKDQAIGISNQKAVQAVKEQEKITAEKNMAVTQVQAVRTAEIQREVQIVTAEQVKRTSVIRAEGEASASIASAEGRAKTSVVEAEGRAKTAVVEAEGHKQQTELVAAGNLTQAKLNAQGIEAEGKARGAADTAVNQATIAAQVALAKEIGENKGYQEYLVTVKKVEAGQAVGVAQAEAIKAAHIKVIANTGNVQDGISSVVDLLSTKGGTSLGAMVDAFAQTDTGAAILSKVGIKTDTPAPAGGNGAVKQH